MNDNTSDDRPNWLEKLDRPEPDRWDPQAEPLLFGRVTDVDNIHGDYGDYPTVTLQTEDGRLVIVHGTPKVLKSRLTKVRPQPGQEVGIKYLGVPEGKSYQNYRVARKPDPDVDDESLDDEPYTEPRDEDVPPDDPWATPSQNS